MILNLICEDHFLVININIIMDKYKYIRIYEYGRNVNKISIDVLTKYDKYLNNIWVT